MAFILAKAQTSWVASTTVLDCQHDLTTALLILVLESYPDRAEPHSTSKDGQANGAVPAVPSLNNVNAMTVLCIALGNNLQKRLQPRTTQHVIALNAGT